jgi:iron complex outermembrane receptor protein
MSLPRRVELDLGFHYVDALPLIEVDAYTNLDARLGWRATREVQISVIGQNLLDDRHAEFDAEYVETMPSEIQRGVFGSISWWF